MLASLRAGFFLWFYAGIHIKDETKFMKEGENKICESIIFRKKSILGGTIMQLVKTKKCEKYCRNTGIKYFRFYEQ